MRTNTFLCYAMLLGIFFVPGRAAGATIYKWVDQNGVTHFSDRKPPETQQIKGPIEERVIEESFATKAMEDSKLATEARNPLEKAINGTFTIKGAKNIGTGFFISSNGYAMTCQHVIENSPNPLAQLDDQSEYPVKVVSISSRADLALLLVSTPHKTPHLLTRNPGTLKPGDRVYAIGASAGLQSTITDGLFTGLRKIQSTDENVIQFSAPINQGNSGGPLIDDEGRVIGVVSRKILTMGEHPVIGVGFAIPSGVMVEEFGTYMEVKD